jgi:hypothetical protein
VSDGHDARRGQGHTSGHAHDDLRYFSHEAQPKVFAAAADLTFDAPAGRPELEHVVRAFLGRLCPALAAAGCVLVGHIKGVVTGEGETELGFSLTRLAGEPRFAGDLAGPMRRATVTVNVIVFGVDGRVLPDLVTGAWPEEMAGAAWRSHEH